MIAETLQVIGIFQPTRSLILLPQQKIIGWIATGTLLCSNFFGLIHFASHAGNTCHHSATPKVACCQHVHKMVPDNTGSSRCRAEKTEQPCCPTQPDDSNSSDNSDQCSICQSFLALRDGFTEAPSLTQWHHPVAIEAVAIIDSAQVGTFSIDAWWTRGPPA